MDGTKDNEIYWEKESDCTEDTVMQKLKKMILLISTVKSSWPSMMHKYHKFVTSI